MMYDEEIYNTFDDCLEKVPKITFSLAPLGIMNEKVEM